MIVTKLYSTTLQLTDKEIQSFNLKWSSTGKAGKLSDSTKNSYMNR